ncbi:hypothetical protein D9619_009717 [Psilocybe cf. subviscida]|uniref:Protein-S-isoprenylcysteine O-methyltransferase n=1 Tax=Psilocybe cf. subviscida TaxID=2480587 RepID=A0A8H5F6E8_9AGAR|nr:hypothetical protein D9619_009717 [Psilocybe cf. subviscida]
MSMLKIPVTILVSWAFKKCVTPPLPPPPKTELMQPNADVEWYTQGVLPIAAAMQVTAGLAEVVTILACNYPGNFLSELILTFLVAHGGRPEALRLSPVTIIGAAMMLSGSLIRVLTYRYLGRFFHYEASIQKNHELIVTGPYSVVRHPSYTGFLLSHPGWFLWQFGAGSWVRESGLWNTVLGKIIVGSYAHTVIVGTLWTVLRRMKSEDDALKRQFGKKWDAWARDVPYLILPGIY